MSLTSLLVVSKPGQHINMFPAFSCGYETANRDWASKGSKM